jgi:uncharacterized membrane protein YcaP (DUF421 family)
MGHWLIDVFNHPSALDLVVILAKTTAIYLFLVVGLRLLGKREMGQMTVYDLVLLIVLANSVQNAMVGTDVTLAGGLVAGTTLLILNRLFNLAILRSKRIANFMVGEPLLLVNEGKILTGHIQKEGITREQIMAALREHGLSKVADVRMAVLEVDGSISIVPGGTDVLRSRHHFRALRVT